MTDYPTPAQCLDEARNELHALKNGAVLPPWYKEELPRLIREAEEQVKKLESHLIDNGNNWA